MFSLSSICSLTDFQRNTKEHIKRLKNTGRPEILTVNGKAELVIQDAESYQKLLEAVQRAEAAQGIHPRPEAVNRKDTMTDEQFFEELRRKYNIPQDL